jgi:hypothetical protein
MHHARVEYHFETAFGATLVRSYARSELRSFGATLVRGFLLEKRASPHSRMGYEDPGIASTIQTRAR